MLIGWCCMESIKPEAVADDRIISAGSASTTAMALALKVLTATHAIEHATMTSVHAYTSDQSLQDYAGPDYRRSRSGAENIIPNDTPAPRWVERALPAVKGKLSGFALNVPVQAGSLLDMTVAFASPAVDAEGVNELFEAAANADPALIAATRDPIVSSDVRGRSESLLVDLQGTMKAGANLIKVLAWHESLGHARRILDVAALYGGLDSARSRGAVLMRVAINGFGRIGRAVFRIAELRDDIEIVAINDLFDHDALAYLLTYDTVMGRFPGGVDIDEGEMVTPNSRARMLKERDPLKLPWRALAVDAVVESTGVFRAREQVAMHLGGGR